MTIKAQQPIPSEVYGAFNVFINAMSASFANAHEVNCDGYFSDAPACESMEELIAEAWGQVHEQIEHDLEEDREEDPDEREPDMASPYED